MVWGADESLCSMYMYILIPLERRQTGGFTSLAFKGPVRAVSQRLCSSLLIFLMLFFISFSSFPLVSHAYCLSLFVKMQKIYFLHYSVLSVTVPSLPRWARTHTDGAQGPRWCHRRPFAHSLADACATFSAPVLPCGVEQWTHAPWKGSTLFPCWFFFPSRCWVSCLSSRCPRNSTTFSIFLVPLCRF